MKSRSRLFTTLRFVLIAVIFMLVVDHFVFGGKRSYIEAARTVPTEPSERDRTAAPPPPVRVAPPDGQAFFEDIPKETDDLSSAADLEKAGPDPVPADAEPAPAPEPAGKPEPPVEIEKPKAHGNARIAVVIDDVGMDVRRSREAIALPAPVTLALLPYAPKVREIAREGKAAGHHLIIHVPMEAMDKTANIGPGGLHTGMSEEAFNAALSKMFESFDGYEGINNHMGSRLTQDSGAMARLMPKLAARNLYFLDSKTVATSVGARAAAQGGVRHAERDVFLDHVETRQFADHALANTEKLALKRGYAIAIGHPKDNTIAALRAWIPGLANKGIELVPVSQLLSKPVARTAQESKPQQPVEAAEPAAPVDLFPADQPPSYRIQSE